MTPYEAVEAMIRQTGERSDMALRATFAHLGCPLPPGAEALDALEKSEGALARVSYVCRIRELPEAIGSMRAMGDAIASAEIRASLEEREVRVDGALVWRGFWQWSASRYTAEWHEDSLTGWMATAMAT